MKREAGVKVRLPDARSPTKMLQLFTAGVWNSNWLRSSLGLVCKDVIAQPARREGALATHGTRQNVHRLIAGSAMN
jgi:hypothetical protein